MSDAVLRFQAKAFAAANGVVTLHQRAETSCELAASRGFAMPAPVAGVAGNWECSLAFHSRKRKSARPNWQGSRCSCCLLHLLVECSTGPCPD